MRSPIRPSLSQSSHLAHCLLLAFQTPACAALTVCAIAEIERRERLRFEVVVASLVELGVR